MKKTLGSGFNLYLHEGIKAKEVIISAHGSYTSKDSYFHVPPGINLHFYCPHGSAFNSQGLYGMVVRHDVPIQRTVAGGALIQNYRLSCFPEKVEVEAILKKRPSESAWDVVTVAASSKGASFEDAIRLLKAEKYSDVHCSFCRVDTAVEDFFPVYTPATAGRQSRVTTARWEDIK